MASKAACCFAALVLAGTVMVSAQTSSLTDGAAATKAVTDSTAIKAKSARIDSMRVLLREGKYAEVERRARILLSELDTPAITDSLMLKNTLSVLAESLWRGGKASHPETRQLAERSTAITEKLKGPEHTDVAAQLNSLGTILTMRGDYADALKTYQRALAIAEKGFGPDHVNIARVLINMVSFYQLTGDYEAAIPLAQRGIAIHEKAQGPESADVGAFLNTLGSLEFLMGDYALSEQHYRRSLAIREKVEGPDHPNVARTVDNLGMLLRTRGDYVAARELGERALAIREKTVGPKHPEYAVNLQNLGLLSADMGDFRAAVECHQRALAIRREALGPEHDDVAASLLNLGSVYNLLGERDSAKAAFELSVATSEKAVGPGHRFVAGALSNLAGTLMMMGDFAEADSLQVRALTIYENAVGPTHPDLIETILDLAASRQVSGRQDDARDLLARSVEIGSQALGPDHPRVATSLGRLAWVEAIQGENTQAVGDALEAARLDREHLRLTSRSLSEGEALRYASQRVLGLDVALSLAGHGLDSGANRRVLDALVRSRAVVLDEMAARHQAASAPGDTLVARLAMDLDSARERIANLMVRGSGAQSPEIYRKLLDQARSQKEEAERKLGGASARFAIEHARARLGLNEVAAALPMRAALVSFAQFEAKDLSTTQAETRKSWGKETEVASTYLAFVSQSGSTEVRAVNLGPHAGIDALVSVWRHAASGRDIGSGESGKAAEGSCRDAGIALRRAIWDPLAPALLGVDRVFVVPDGSLNLINLAALPMDDGAYLIEHGPIVHLISAERDLVPSTASSRGEGLVAIGKPDYDATEMFASLGTKGAREASGSTQKHADPILLASADVFRGQLSDCAELSSMQFRPLPATGKEAKEIVQLWDQQERNKSAEQVEPLFLHDAEASETTLKANAPGHRVLHLATHGFFLSGDCGPALEEGRGIGGLEETPIAKAPTANGQTASAPTANAQTANAAVSTTVAAGENPLLLSGLVLAGANHRSAAGEGEDDGILTAEEIASLDLSGVEWAVLSACETGVGDIRVGEGVFGLRRAFQIAGAGTLIMSLWSVDDESTRSWMKALYKARLIDQLDTAESVRKASLALLQERRGRKQSTHPFFWAAFVAAGDWR